jgi:methionine biosynthesis protein MetW
MIDRQLNYGRDVIAEFFKKIAPYDRVLDVGAGSGADLEAARLACPSMNGFAVESFPPNVLALSKRGVHVHAVNVERDALPFDNASFDVIMSNQTLEHVKEIFWIMHEISRTLKVNGHLIVGVPNLASFHNRLLLLAGRQPTCLKNYSAHVRGYTRPDILNLFQSVFPVGYELVAFAGSNFYPFPPWIAKPLAKLAPANAWAIFFLLKKVKPYDKQFLEFPVKQELETNFHLGDEAARFQHIL